MNGDKKKNVGKPLPWESETSEVHRNGIMEKDGRPAQRLGEFFFQKPQRLESQVRFSNGIRPTLPALGGRGGDYTAREP